MMRRSSSARRPLAGAVLLLAALTVWLVARATAPDKQPVRVRVAPTPRRPGTSTATGSARTAAEAYEPAPAGWHPIDVERAPSGGEQPRRLPRAGDAFRTDAARCERRGEGQGLAEMIVFCGCGLLYVAGVALSGPVVDDLCAAHSARWYTVTL